MGRPTGGAVYFSALGRSYAATGRSIPPSHFYDLPEWCLDAFDIGFAMQRRESLKRFLKRTSSGKGGTRE